MGLALMGGWVASAGAVQAPLLTLPTITLPTVTLPTVTLPTVTLPTVTTPTVTVPPVPPPPPLPPAPPAPITVPGVTLPSAHPPPPPPGSGGGGGSSGGGGSQGGGGSAGTGSGASGQSAGGTSGGRQAGTGTSRVYRLRLARDWISRTGPRRRTKLVFILRRPALVEFVVLQVAPDCRRVGRFRVRGHRGVNRVRIPARVGRRTTGARDVQGRGASDSERANGRTRAARRRRSREPRPDPSGPEARTHAGKPRVSGLQTPPRPPAGALSDPAQPKGARHAARHHGVLGARFDKAAISAAKDVPLWVSVLLGVAVALLVAAAFLPKSETVGLSASLLLGLTGATILLGLTITYAFG